MYIFIDTNVFYNNWFLKSADFKFLFNFVENTDGVLLMSDLVCEEVNNLQEREINSIVNNLENEVRKSWKLTLTKNGFDFASLREKFDFNEVLKEKTRLIKYFSYSEVRQEEVVKRALKKIRPFQEEEKGYRDTLIWLSLLGFLKKNSISRDVIFISNNKNDFYDGKRTEFHDDLKKDIQAWDLKCKILPFDSLHSFVTSQVDKAKHQYTYFELYEKYLHSIDEYLQDYAKSHLNQLSSEDFKNLILNSNESFPGIDFLIDHSFEIDEGVEDAEVLRYNIISDELIYVNYTYNLRRCTLILTIPSTGYELHRAVIDKNYYEIVTQGDQTTFYAFARVYLEVSFNFNTKGEFIEGYDILKADFSRK